MSTSFSPSDPASGAARERSHAARNRLLVLDAAGRLFRERGVECVTMDEVAQAAGVGKGTVYRRFGDRAGLAAAVLDERERVLQAAMIRGEPPLGPGAPPVDRLHAFLGALLDLLEDAGDLILVAETARSGARYRSSIYAAHRLHVAVLLRAALGGADPGALPDLVLAPLAADLHRHLRREREVPCEAIRAGLRRLVDGVAGPGPDGPPTAAC